MNDKLLGRITAITITFIICGTIVFTAWTVRENSKTGLLRTQAFINNGYVQQKDQVCDKYHSTLTWVKPVPEEDYPVSLYGSVEIKED